MADKKYTEFVFTVVVDNKTVRCIDTRTRKTIFLGNSVEAMGINVQSYVEDNIRPAYINDTPNAMGDF